MTFAKTFKKLLTGAVFGLGLAGAASAGTLVSCAPLAGLLMTRVLMQKILLKNDGLKVTSRR